MTAHPATDVWEASRLTDPTPEPFRPFVLDVGNTEIWK